MTCRSLNSRVTLSPSPLSSKHSVLILQPPTGRNGIGIDCCVQRDTAHWNAKGKASQREEIDGLYENVHLWMSKIVTKFKGKPQCKYLPQLLQKEFMQINNKNYSFKWKMAKRMKKIIHKRQIMKDNNPIRQIYRDCHQEMQIKPNRKWPLLPCNIIIFSFFNETIQNQALSGDHKVKQNFWKAICHSMSRALKMFPSFDLVILPLGIYTRNVSFLHKDLQLRCTYGNKTLLITSVPDISQTLVPQVIELCASIKYDTWEEIVTKWKNATVVGKCMLKLYGYRYIY